MKDCLRIAVASTGSAQMENWNGGGSSLGSLADDYDYVMYGKVYKKADSKQTSSESTSEVTLYASFGGLLMSLAADKADLEGAHLDDRVYLLVKKVY
jgi:DNA-directed RNA polymerase I, II, and III subunit RPABC3